ncbi:MAG: hypothetical protein HQK87_05960, partial [Nitrospinae bacterium]|nr:hypothetical protein [Nitrospinota bacterium]
MTRHYLCFAITIALCLVGAAGGAAAETFTPAGMLFAPAPTGHAPGKDNAAESGASQGNGLHMAGNDCGICH